MLAVPVDPCGEEPNVGGVLDPVAEMVKLGEEKLVAPIRKLREGTEGVGEGSRWAASGKL